MIRHDVTTVGIGSPQIPHFMFCSAILWVSNFFISAGDLISRYPLG